MKQAGPTREIQNIYSKNFTHSSDLTLTFLKVDQCTPFTQRHEYEPVWANGNMLGTSDVGWTDGLTDQYRAPAE